MQTYIGTKILGGKPMNKLDYCNLRGWEVPADENPLEPGYLVEYRDGGQANVAGFTGYVSWSPTVVFENSYRPTAQMTFGDALVFLKKGHQVARAGWNGKGQFVFMVTGPQLQDALKYGYGEYLGESMIQSALAIKTTSNQIQIGWLASQADMLAEDWTLVE